MKDYLFYSFYTNDAYYIDSKVLLEKNLVGHQIPHKIERIDIPDGMQWSDICRKKIPLLHSICKQHPDKKIFWIDVDCQLNYFPDYIANFSCDIVGFSRGYSSPLKLGYHLRSRFWEPSLIGINNTPNGRMFIERAAEIEKDFQGNATDDYFFEESWRENCDSLSFQIIPSSEKVTSIAPTGFFVFGASGNVNNFVGKVEQHSKLDFSSVSRRQRLISLLSSLKLLRPAKWILDQCKDFKFRTHVKWFALKIINSACRNESGKVQKYSNLRVFFSNSDKLKVIRVGRAILEYRNPEIAKNNIPLCWWFSPSPGNFGDWLSPYIVTKVGQCSVTLIKPSNMPDYRHQNLLSTGSIGKFANDNSIVLGAGISTEDAALNKNALYLSVRGPRTGRAIEISGGTDPCVYGDPAIVMPVIFPRKHTDNGRVAMVRHMSHRNLPLILPDNFDEISIMGCSANDIEEFVSTICSYNSVITSAMHCYILCQAYGIPHCLVTWSGYENRVAGDGIKYIDYAEGAGVTPQSPTVIPLDLRAFVLADIISTETVPKQKIEELYKFLLESLQAYQTHP